jgi:hypothetical protein
MPVWLVAGSLRDNAVFAGNDKALMQMLGAPCGIVFLSSFSWHVALIRPGFVVNAYDCGVCGLTWFK